MIEQQKRSPGLGPALAVLGFLSLIVGRGIAVEMCLAPDGLDQWNVTVDCDSLNPVAHPNAWFGYSEFGVPCTSFYDCASMDYGWAISSSDTDPYVWTGALPRPTAELHLWFLCMWQWQSGGWQWAQFAVETTGGEVLSFEPRNGARNLGSATDLWLVPDGGCADGDPLLVGTWTVETAVHVESGAWGSVKSLYR